MMFSSSLILSKVGKRLFKLIKIELQAIFKYPTTTSLI
mgnify:CR=1 FL=1